MRRCLEDRMARHLLVVALVLVFSSGPLAFGGKAEATDETANGLAKVYVFYSEPPFDYQPVKTIRIRLASVWDRERKERKIRKEVAKAGGDVVILERSFLKMDQPPREVYEPTPAGPRMKVLVPPQSAYVEGRVANRIEETPARDCERFYTADFAPAWDAVLGAVDALGWQLQTVDHESRFLTTMPAVTAAVAMECDDERTEWLPAVFTAYVNNYRDTSLVRLDVTFVDRETGAPTACRSVGVYEAAFFKQLDKRLVTEP